MAQSSKLNARKQIARKNTKERKIIRLPYLRKLATRGPITVWQVDGAYIRTRKDEEFSNFGHHFTFSYIPKDEFWIDQGIEPEEQKFFIKHMSVEYRLMKQGASYDNARAKANKIEQAQRRRAGDLRKLTHNGRQLPEPSQAHHKLWKKLENGLSVWIVNARLVRSVFDDEFASGGHDQVYEFIPENEIWIDGTLKAAERPYALVHELHERGLMIKGIDYERAHEESSKLEHRCRKHPDQLHDALKKEGWE